MKVLFHIGSSYWPGYFEACTETIARLREDGHTVVLWSTIPESTAWFREHTEETPVEFHDSVAALHVESRVSSSLSNFMKDYLDLDRIAELHQLLFKPPTALGVSQKRAFTWLLAVLELLVEHRPHAVVLYNGFHPYALAMRCLCEKLGVAVLLMEKGLLAHSFQLDPRGINAESSLARETKPSLHDPEQIKQDLTALRAELFGNGVTGWDQNAGRIGGDALRQRLGLTRDARVLLYVGQVKSDSNIIFFSPYFRGNEEALRFLTEHLPKDEDWFILGKRHPFGEDDDAAIRRMLGDSGAWLDDVHLHDALEAAAAVVSINSSVVFESLLLRKPTILLGRGLFNGKGVAFEYDGENAESLRQFLREARPPCGTDMLDYWCWRTAFQWLFRTRPETIESESRRVAAVVARAAEGTEFSDKMLGSIVWSAVRAQVHVSHSLAQDVAALRRERDAACVERDTARVERDATYVERSSALAEAERFRIGLEIARNRLPVRIYRSLRRMFRRLMGRGD
jgi:hypothetical protein